MALLNRKLVNDGPACRICGCTENNACDDGLGGGCYWIKQEKGSPPLCSACSGTAADLDEALRRMSSLVMRLGSTADVATACKNIARAAHLRFKQRRSRAAAA